MTLNDIAEEAPEGFNILTSDDAFYVYKNYSIKKLEERNTLRAESLVKSSKFLANTETFVISGMSGRFPESDSIEEFEHNLYNNIDMVVEDEKRWPFGYLGLPKGSGKLKDVSLFDHKFFRIDEKDAHYLDSQLRIMLEITFEALWDAGIDPATLAGSNTGVFLGNCFDEYLAAYSSDDGTNVPTFRQCFYAQLHNAFDLRGPAKSYDTACASSFSALHEAVVSLRADQCDRAIVLGLNLCLRAGTQNQFLNLNMISPDGHCKCLDDDANGYAKGEACVAIILQKATEAKRVYAKIVHTKTNCDGYKDLGITYPSFELQRELIEDTYKEIDLDPNEIEYCEAHCTGTQAGDPSEMRAIVESMCTNRKNPLLIGAIKSIIGHTEASSGLCSLVKTVLSFEKEMIPANLHMTKINHRIDGLVNGILKPIITNTEFKGRHIALNCFGFGGVNVHVIIEKNQKEPSKFWIDDGGDLPRLVVFCGRNVKTLNKIQSQLIGARLTPHLLSLLNDISKTSPYPSSMFRGMSYRGFLIVDKQTDQNEEVCLKPITKLKWNKIKSKTRPSVCFVFTGMGCQWPSMGRQLMKIDFIRKILERCSKVLSNIDEQINLIDLLTEDNPELLKSPVNSFVSIAAIQIALVEFLKFLDIEPDYIFGHSIGELSCAYADQCLTLEETMACALARGLCVQQAMAKTAGAMAAIGCSWSEANDWCQKYSDQLKVWPACHNSADSVTISGSKEEIDQFLGLVQKDQPDLFARLVNSSNIAFHCPLIDSIQKPLLKKLKQIIKSEPKSLSRWLSTTYPEELEDDREFSAQYLVDNLIKPVRFHDAFKRLTGKNLIYIEIAPHNLLQSIIKRNALELVSSELVNYVPTVVRKSGSSNDVQDFLENIGELYNVGLNPRIERLYPKVEYPVPRTTAPLNSIISWKHDRHFTVTQYPDFFNINKRSQKIKSIDLQHQNDKFLSDHCVDNRVLFPATGYLYIVWELIAHSFNKKLEDLPIVFEDVKLHRATIMPKTGVINFEIRHSNETGSFVILESGSMTTSGRVTFPKTDFLKHQSLINVIGEKLNQKTSSKCLMEMENRDVYKEFRLRGYDYGPEFQLIQNLKQFDYSLIGKIGYKNWITFVDGMIQMAILGRSSRGLYLPVRLQTLRCDPRIFFKVANTQENDSESKSMYSIFDGLINVGVAPGIEFQNIKANLAPRKVHNKVPVEDLFEFVAHDELDLPYCKSRANSHQHSIYLTDQLKSYQEECLKLIIEKNKPDDFSQFDPEKFESLLSDPVLWKQLKKFDFNELNQFDLLKLIENIDEDIVFQTYFNERFIRSQLEIAAENIRDFNIRILEVGQTPNLLANQIIQWMMLLAFKVTFSYEILHSSLEKLNQSQNLSMITGQHKWSMETKKFPSDVQSFDIVLYRDSSLCPLLADQRADLKTTIDSLWDSLKEERFALIFIRDKLFPFEIELMRLLDKEWNKSSRLDEFMRALETSQFNIIGHKSDQFGVHALFVKKIVMDIVPEQQIFINITENITDWFEKLQTILKQMKEDSTLQKQIWLLADQRDSGVIGFISCLFKEPTCDKVRCLLNLRPNNPIDIQTKSIQALIKQSLCTNVINPGGLIGCYKHFTLPIDQKEPTLVEHCFLSVATRGDLSSLRWFESQHKHWPKNIRNENQLLCTVYFAAINFRDIMLASGKLPPDALPDDIGLDDCLMGLEFSGRDENGNRVMGMVPAKGLATTVVMDKTKFLWQIPSKWTMEEASTLPVAYMTAYYALNVRGRLQPGEKVLIHSGSGAVGQAAIAVCLGLNCQLFITVGSDAKRDLLMETFPTLKLNQFANSRNTDFEKFILRETNGLGVDIVLNSLAEEKLQASIECLAENGRFLEIGKFDLSQDNKIDLSKMMGNKEFHGILLDNMLSFGPGVPKRTYRHRQQILDLMCEGIENGVVRPLNRTIYTADKCEEAFRFMASGKHTGKVVIQLREEEKPYGPLASESIAPLRIPAVPRTVFLPHKSYIITGGLGGFGLELINWMIEREARNFLITSRSGVKDLYQKNRLKYFSDCGARCKIITDDMLIEANVEKLIQEAELLGPLGGLFHLAMVLNDGLFENQTIQSFENVVKPKAQTFRLLDKLTRQKSLNLDYFVAFSSVSCGVGNPGQSNYGYANSVMERICDQRRLDGLHGFAIQWGAIGDVGYIIDNIRGNEVVVCGSVPQRVPSCLNSLDRLLQSSYSVCSSLVKIDQKAFEAGCGKTSLIKTIAHILGVKDYESLEPNLTLAELGMDSLMSVEVKQAIERDYDFVLTMQDIRKLTIGRILEISKEKAKTADTENPINEKNKQQNELIDNKLIPIVYLNDILNGDPIIFLPPLDSTYDLLIPLARKLNRPAIGINWTKECKKLETVENTAAHYIEVLEHNLPKLTSNYDLIGYSFGGIVAFEMTNKLRQRKVGRLQACRKLVLLDSSPKQFHIYTEETAKRYSIKDESHAYIETIVLFLMEKLAIDGMKIKKQLMALPDNAERIKLVRELFKQTTKVDIQSETLETLIQSYYNKISMMRQYGSVERRFEGDVLLVRASVTIIQDKSIMLGDDYFLGEVIDNGQCHLHILKGDHKTFISDNYDEISSIIRDYLEK